MPQNDKTTTTPAPTSSTQSNGQLVAVDPNRASGSWLVAPVQLVPAK